MNDVATLPFANSPRTTMPDYTTGILLICLGNLCAATGLTLMKSSTVHEGEKPFFLRWRWLAGPRAALGLSGRLWRNFSRIPICEASQEKTGPQRVNMLRGGSSCSSASSCCAILLECWRRRLRDLPGRRGGRPKCSGGPWSVIWKLRA